MELNHSALRPMDAVCTAAASAFGGGIRAWTAPLKSKNPLAEMFRLKVANHVGYIVQHSGKNWIAEMVGGGLKINSLNEYLRNPNKNRIVAVVRNPLFENESLRLAAMNYVIKKAYELVDYDYKGSPGAFIGLCGDGPKDWYCSEMVEAVANTFGGTWDRWQLSRDTRRRIAPIEIDLGKNAHRVTDALIL